MVVAAVGLEAAGVSLPDPLWRMRNQKHYEELSEANRQYEWNEVEDEKIQHHENATQTEEGIY